MTFANCCASQTKHVESVKHRGSIISQRMNRRNLQKLRANERTRSRRASWSWFNEFVPVSVRIRFMDTSDPSETLRPTGKRIRFAACRCRETDDVTVMYRDFLLIPNSKPMSQNLVGRNISSPHIIPTEHLGRCERNRSAVC